MIFATPEAELEAYSQELAARFRREQPPPPQPANVEAAITLTDAALLQYRRRRFRVPPVPARAGFMLRALEARLMLIEREPLTPETIEARIGLLEEAVALMAQLVRPLGVLDRLTWRLRGNPFRQAEAGELVALINFFCDARTTIRVKWTGSDRAPARWNTIWPPISPNSSRTFLRGSTALAPTPAIRSRGGTT